MKGMKSAAEYYTPPPEGTYPATVISAEPQISKAGSAMIHMQSQLDNMNEVVDDYIITDGTQKGGGIGKGKLRGLGIDVTSDMEVPDSVICQQLIGRKTNIVVGHEQSQRKNEAGELIPAVYVNPETGQQIPLKRLTVKGYVQANIGGFAQGAPQGQPVAAPQFAAPPQAQYAQAPAAPQFQQPAPQQYAPPMPQQAAPAQTFAPPGFPQQPLPPQGTPLPPAPQYAPPLPQAQAPWAQPPGAAAPAAPTDAGRRLKITDTQ